MILQAAGQADLYIYNSLDPLLAGPAADLESSGMRCVSYGVAKPLLKSVINEQTIHGQTSTSGSPASNVLLMSFDEIDHKLIVTLRLGDDSPDGKLQTSIPLQGFHNALNAAAVGALLQTIVPECVVSGFKAISTMETPFGRGERLHLADKNVSVALVKNPSGFTSNLLTFVQSNPPEIVLFVVNDNFADGRDISWLWDVEFRDKIAGTTTIYTSGSRGYDMALRLKHDGYDAQCILNVQEAIDKLFTLKVCDIVVIPTYTALFEVRSALAKYGKVARIW